MLKPAFQAIVKLVVKIQESDHLDFAASLFLLATIDKNPPKGSFFQKSLESMKSLEEITSDGLPSLDLDRQNMLAEVKKQIELVPGAVSQEMEVVFLAAMVPVFERFADNQILE